MTVKKLLLIDGHSLAYRAFYGLPLYDRGGKPSFTTSKGEYTNAVYGFANMLLKVWADEQPDGIAVAFDLGRTFRDDLFEDYKGTREKMPDELVPQIDRIVELVEAFDIPAVSAEGFEADDVLGTLATRAAADGLDVIIVTGDTDAFQLVGPRVRVLTSGRSFNDTSVYDEAAVRERYGLEPAQLIDYKALKGDTSDNIPGVKGIGEKTATALLQTYGSVESVYEHLEEVTPPRAKNALEAGHDIALLSKDLVTIRTAIDIDLTWDACAVHTYDRAKVETLFDELEFMGIRGRLPRIAGEAEPTVAPPRAAAGGGERQMSMFTPGDDGQAPEPMAIAPDTTLVTVRDPATLDRLVAELAAAPVIAFDTETTDTDTMKAELVGLSFAVREGEGWYVPVGHSGEVDAGRQLTMAEVLDALRPTLEDPTRPKVAHNAKYDMEVLRQAGIEVRGVTFDTMIAEFLIDPGARLGLKALAKFRLGTEMTDIDVLIGKGKSQITMAEVPVDQAAPYAAADADMTWRLMQLQAPELDRLAVRPLFDEIEMPLLPVLVDMELAGVRVDVDFLLAMSERLGKRLVEIEDAVYQLVGTPFNLNSPQQLAEVLFTHLGLSAPGARKTSTGKMSVAADVLESMQGLHPVIDLVLEHRQLSKLKGTYLDALPRLVDPAGRVHTTFSMTSAVSGRLASQDPNLQNIPIRTELGKEVRRAFIPAPGNLLIAADYSQVELRICAHISGDPGLRAAFEAGEDIHRATAAKVLGIPPEEVTGDQRRFAKCVEAGTLVSTNQGLVPIERLGLGMKPGEYRPADLVVHTDDGLQRATHIYCGGQQAILRITTKDGLTVGCTPQHRLRVMDEEGEYVWRFAEDIAVGDRVAVWIGAQAAGSGISLPAVALPPDLRRTNFQDIELPSEWSTALARFLGYLVSEGYIYRHSNRGYAGTLTMSQSLADVQVADDMAGVARWLFGRRVRVRDRRGHRFVMVSSGKLLSWLDALGFSGRSHSKTIPDCVLSAPRWAQVEFFRALFTGDGSLKSRQAVVAYSTKSPMVAKRAQVALANLGFRFTLKSERRNRYPDPYYELRLGGTAEVRRFVRTIGFIGDRRRRVLGSRHHDYSEVPNQHAWIQKAYPLLSGVTRDKAYEVLRPASPVRLNRRRAAMIVTQLAERGDARDLVRHFEPLIRQELRFAEVTGVEADEADVFDLVVPGNHTYIANGFVSHNTVNYGILYGMGIQSLAQQAGITTKEAKQFVDAYFAGFPNVRTYIDETKLKAKEDGYVETLLGRRRYFPILQSTTRDARTNVMQRSAEREAVNHPLQGSAADIIKIAMIRIHHALRERGLDARQILQVHDELVLEAAEGQAAEAAKLVQELMEGAYPLDPPLKVDVGIGANWDAVK